MPGFPLITPEIKKSIISLGVSFPGLVNASNRIVERSVHFSEFYNRPVAEEFEASLNMDIPVFVERNEVCDLIDLVINQNINKDTLLISLQSGVSAALYSDGNILAGKTGNFAILWHLPHSESEMPCLCGKKGCIETLVVEVAWKLGFLKISKLPEAQK